MTNKSMKRIHKVVVKRMFDESPDTSHMGEYASRPTSEFSIDRKHALDCASQTYNVRVEDIRTIKHAITYLNDSYLHGQWPSDSPFVTDYSDAAEVLGEALDAIGECDCDESGDMGRNEYQYFNPSFNYVDKSGHALPENTPDEVRKYTREDYERMQSLHRGDWYYMGVRADAEVQLSGMATPNPIPNTVVTPSYVIQTVTSSGLWGIESDSDASYIAEVEAEELAQLRTQLAAIGFSKRAIAAAFKSVEHVDVG